MAALLLSLLPLPVSAAPCSVAVGQRVLLAATNSDPSVFVWDSSENLVDYAAGQYNSVEEVVRHTALVSPGTHAIVAMCRRGVVRRRYVDQAFDAVGIKVTAGPLRSRWGWVASDDVHALNGTGAAKR